MLSLNLRRFFADAVGSALGFHMMDERWCGESAKGRR